MSRFSPKRIARFVVLLGAILLGINAYAGDIQIENAWVRASAPGQDSAMVDLAIVSSKDAVLTGVHSPVSTKASMHSMKHEDGMMKMRESKSIELPAGKRINLGENGYHLMLEGLKNPIRAGETVPLVLTITKPGGITEQVEILAEVRPLTAARKVPHEDKHMQHHH